MSQELVEAAAAAKHDLGKYVAFQARWLAPDASDADRLEALQADVLHTRRSAEGSEDAPSLWRRLRPGLAALEADADLVAVDQAIGRSSNQAIGSIDSIDSTSFRSFGHVGELEICLVSKFQLRTTLGGQQTPTKTKQNKFVFLTSSILSIRYFF